MTVDLSESSVSPKGGFYHGPVTKPTSVTKCVVKNGEVSKVRVPASTPAAPEPKGPGFVKKNEGILGFILGWFLVR
jgi:hypothetical protein